MGHEMHGMAFYTPPPSDMINRETKELKDRIKQLEKELYNSDLNFRKNVARRNNCEVTDVTIKDNGEAYIY